MTSWNSKRLHVVYLQGVVLNVISYASTSGFRIFFWLFEYICIKLQQLFVTVFCSQVCKICWYLDTSLVILKPMFLFHFYLSKCWKIFTSTNPTLLGSLWPMMTWWVHNLSFWATFSAFSRALCRTRLASFVSITSCVNQHSGKFSASQSCTILSCRINRHSHYLISFLQWSYV